MVFKDFRVWPSGFVLPGPMFICSFEAHHAVYYIPPRRHSHLYGGVGVDPGTPCSADFLPLLRLLYPSGALTSTHRVARRQEGHAQSALPFGLSLQLFSSISEGALPPTAFFVLRIGISRVSVCVCVCVYVCVCVCVWGVAPPQRYLRIVAS